MIDRVLRRPRLSCVLSAGLLVALALPALGMHVAKPSDESLSPQTEPALPTLGRVRADVPEHGGAGDRRRRRAARAAGGGRARSQRLEALAVARGIAHPPFTLSGERRRHAAAARAAAHRRRRQRGEPAAIAVLRDDLIPQTLGRVPGVETGRHRRHGRGRRLHPPDEARHART